MQQSYRPLDLSTVDWHNELVRLGIPKQCLSKHAHVACPICKRDKSFRFDNYQQEGNWICKSCGSGKGPRLIHAAIGTDYASIYSMLGDASQVANPNKISYSSTTAPSELTEKEIVRNRKRLREAWTGSTWLQRDDTASRYLRARVPFLDLDRLDCSMRFHPKMAFFEWENNESILRGQFPTHLAVVQDAKGTFITMHRTYLTPSAEKVPFENAKLQMSGIRKLHGAGIHLVSNPQSRVLAVGEGTETMLAVGVAHQYQINVRSYLNAGNLSKADIPRSLFDKVIIYADHDKIDVHKGYRPGEHYAGLLSRRLKEMGFEVEVRLPQSEGEDWADVWMTATNLLGDFTNRLLTELLNKKCDHPFGLIASMLRAT